MAASSDAYEHDVGSGPWTCSRTTSIRGCPAPSVYSPCWTASEHDRPGSTTVRPGLPPTTAGSPSVAPNGALRANSTVTLPMVDSGNPHWQEKPPNPGHDLVEVPEADPISSGVSR